MSKKIIQCLAEKVMFSQKMKYEYKAHATWVSDLIDFPDLVHHTFLQLYFICITDVLIDLASQEV